MESKKTTGPEALAREVLDLCADCEHCRELMDDTPCFVFPELFRLADAEKESDTHPTSQQLQALVELCNFCGLCPCPNVRTGLRKSKDAFVNRDGMKPALRILQDVNRIGKVCGAFPWLANALSQHNPGAAVLKQIGGIHPDRQLPKFPNSNFMTWAERRGIHQKRGGAGRKVAFFVGCTAKYLFPQVAIAAVEVLEQNGIEVFVPEQQCCGMPSLLEGDRNFTLERASFNMKTFSEAVDDGYEIVCSCPTCGYMLKNVFSEGAYVSDEFRSVFQEQVKEAAGDSEKFRAATRPIRNRPALSASLIMSGLLRDESYFASLSANQRIKISSNTYDLGEYLLRLHDAGELNRSLGPVPQHSAYYPPCHQREQSIGQPWAKLLRLIPEMTLEQVGGAFDCCGMAGVMGFKREFHDISVEMGTSLMDKIRAAHPDKLLSDCLSCRLQFEQLLPYSVSHPVEVLAASYAAAFKPGNTAEEVTMRTDASFDSKLGPA